MKQYVEVKAGLVKESKETMLSTAKLLVCLACAFTSLVTSMVNPVSSLGLVLRVPLLICCSHTFFYMAQVYARVLIHNLKYFLLMWMSICIFWAAGDVLFSSEELPDSVNFFTSFFEVVWNLLVLQSTANFPDVSLPFVVKRIASIVYFMVFLFCNTIIISNLIIANSYNAYKENIEKYELTEGLPKVLLEVIKTKQRKIQEVHAIKNMSSSSLCMREMVNSTFYRLTQWLLNVVLFIVVCFHPLK